MEKLAYALVMSTRKLRPYFLQHPIEVLSNYPLRQVLQKSDTSGRLVKWTVELGQFELHYRPRTLVKSQALADFVAESSVRSTSPVPNKKNVGLSLLMDHQPKCAQGLELCR
ncbi:rve domain-containing [Abeliophyllum distichum]|uniref:Rve domain-containing n=1 Tax=Abeliophyllum distichum TaxID=126358 RepID=A0ABD1QH76_9LAMI